MSEWRTAKLGDVCEIVRGGSPRPIMDYITDSIDGVNWLKIGDVSEHDKYLTHSAEKIKVSGISKSREVVKGDLVLSNSMSYGRVFITLIDGYIHDGWLRIRNNDTVLDKEFLYYFLSSDVAQNQFKAVATGSVVNNLKTETVKAVEIPLPSLHEQRAIASSLSVLDDKIAINNNINNHLEQIAQAIFRSWFVDFEPFKFGSFVVSELGNIPSSWSVLPIEEIAEKVAMGPFGSNIKVETFVESGVPIISGNHLRGLYLDESKYNFITENHAQKLANSLVRAGDIVFTHAGNIGQVALIPEDCDYPYYIISQRQFYLRCNRQKVLPEYINYYFHSREGQGKLLANASQTGVPSIARPSSHLKSIVVPIPPIKVQLKWLNIVKPMFQMLNSNKKENKSLATIRDTLLPRLMSSELLINGDSETK